MTAHRCSDSAGWNERLTLVHANEGKCKECELFITVMIGLGIRNRERLLSGG